MFAADVPTYSIDLGSAEAERWAEVISCETTVASALVREAGAEFERVPELLRWVFARLYQAVGGLYRGEIASWADALGVSPGTATILNCAYELSHLRWPRLFGCTAGVRWVDGLGMVHVRTLDWPLPSMGAGTRVFRFRRGAREFVSVGVPGYVGVLSGMVPRAYSVTINWAPPAAFPSFEFGPGFLLRDTLETCDTYDAAVERLTRTPLSTSVFFTVCGTEKDQACVVERTPREAAVRTTTGPVLAQANHHVAGRFVKNNDGLPKGEEGEEEFSVDGSGRRAETLARVLTEIRSACGLEAAAHVLDAPGVLNPLTCQQMAFCPRTGDVKVWRRVEG
ncbi:MAG: acyl-coenzyme A:6-aminopenicillanic acid acyl-transferase [Gemmataceae bacterium]|nr:acyl-coenzyme A:6-aminopenicillanic acid acyl-transferase [Gemmataceae bacterium]